MRESHPVHFVVENSENDLLDELLDRNDKVAESQLARANESATPGGTPLSTGSGCTRQPISE
jgi:hypothetical protein